MLAAGNEGDGGVVFLLLVANVVTLVWLFLWRRRIVRAGYRGAFAYLRGLPRTDSEKRDALDLVMRGIVMLIPGWAVWSLGIAGLFSLYYGIRKLLMLWMGLELPEESNGIIGEPATERDSAGTSI